MAEFTEETRNLIWAAAHTTPAVDIRVMIRPPAAGTPAVSGIDALLTSPAILSEFFRRRSLNRRDPAAEADNVAAREAYVRSLTPGELADIVWRQLFLDHSPLSEAARVVLTTLGLYGIDVSSGDLRLLREQFEAVPATERVERAVKLANLDLILHPVDSMHVDDALRPAGGGRAFRPVLYLNELLGDWKESARKLRLQGFGLKAKVDEFTPIELRRHLATEIARLKPVALGLDWPRGHNPDDGCVGRLVREGALPLCREHNLPFFLAVDDAGTEPAGRPTSVDDLAPLWEDYPDVRFFLFPSREDHLGPAIAAASRGRNLLLCGPDRPLAGPAVLDGFTTRRLEASGSAFHACHSGAETMEELVGRWAHMRWCLGKTLIRHYMDVWRTGWTFDENNIRKDIAALLGGNARVLLGV